MCFSVATCCVAIRFFDCAMDLVMMLLKIHGVVSVEDDSFDFHNDDNSFFIHSCRISSIDSFGI